MLHRPRLMGIITVQENFSNFSLSSLIITELKRNLFFKPSEREKRQCVKWNIFKSNSLITLVFFNDFTPATSCFSLAINPAQEIKTLNVSFEAPKLPLKFVSCLLNTSCEIWQIISQYRSFILPRLKIVCPFILYKYSKPAVTDA